MKTAQIVNLLEQIAPVGLAEDWDNVGLLIGARGANVRKVMLCIDLTPEVLREAIAEEVREEGVVVSAFCPGPTLTEFRAVSRGRDDLPVPAGVPDAATVAAAGYAALWRARQVFIPGVKNRLMALSVRWAPRAFVARTVHRMQQRR